MRLSIVVPCYNDETAIRFFYGAIARMAEEWKLSDLSLELLFVDDGSVDGTFSVVKALSEADSRVRYVALSRNFGKDAAIYAGLENAVGDYVAIMDADMQDPPALLPQMLAAVSSGMCDVARARRIDHKGDPAIKSGLARRLYKTLGSISGVELADGVRDYQVMNRRVVNAVVSLGEYNRFFKGIASWVGFKTEWFLYENPGRAAGESKWGFWSLAKYGISGVSSFSAAPLKMASMCAVICFLVAVVLAIAVIVRTLAFGGTAAGWASIMCVMLAIGGMQFLFLGMMGSYLGKTYLESKNRPIYIAREVNVAGRGLQEAKAAGTGAGASAGDSAVVEYVLDKPVASEVAEKAPKEAAAKTASPLSVHDAKAASPSSIDTASKPSTLGGSATQSASKVFSRHSKIEAMQADGDPIAREAAEPQPVEDESKTEDGFSRAIQSGDAAGSFVAINVSPAAEDGGFTVDGEFVGEDADAEEISETDALADAVNRPGELEDELYDVEDESYDVDDDLGDFDDLDDIDEYEAPSENDRIAEITDVDDVYFDTVNFPIMENRYSQRPVNPVPVRTHGQHASHERGFERTAQRSGWDSAGMPSQIYKRPSRSYTPADQYGMGSARRYDMGNYPQDPDDIDPEE